MIIATLRHGLAVRASVAALGCLVAFGCGPAAAPRPVRPARPAAAADDHDHGHKHDHEHGSKSAKKDDHDDDHEHAHPETLAEGLVAVEKMWTGIRTALKAGKLDEADDMVHEVGHLLEDLPALLEKAKLPAAVTEAGKKAIDEIFSCFESIDTALHAGEEEAKKLDLDGLSSRIEAAFKSVSGLGT